MNQVVFTSRSDAESTPGREDWAIISITKPGRGPANLRWGWCGILRLSFHDLSTEERRNSSRQIFSHEQAREVWTFVDDHAPFVDGILIHCDAGISRSAAVAKAIAERYALSFPVGYDMHNRLVLSKLQDTAPPPPVS
jgi:predicted protein tyrosine phosphatase